MAILRNGDSFSTVLLTTVCSS